LSVNRVSVEEKPPESNGHVKELPTPDSQPGNTPKEPLKKFNLGSLKGGERFAKGASGNSVILGCGLGKPKAYFRAHPTCHAQVICLTVSGEGGGKDAGQYLIDSEEVADLLALEENKDVKVAPFRLTLVYDTDQKHMIYPVRLAWAGHENQLDQAAMSAQAGVEVAQTQFIKLWWDGRRFQYKPWSGSPLPEPDWTQRTIDEWAEMAFKGRIISSVDDPVLLRQLGKKL
jgi:hypothetical protein